MCKSEKIKLIGKLEVIRELQVKSYAHTLLVERSANLFSRYLSRDILAKLHSRACSEGFSSSADLSTSRAKKVPLHHASSEVDL